MANLAEFKDAGAVAPKAKSFSELLTTMMPQFKTALPAHLKANAERYMRLAVTEMRRNPALAKCDPYSVLGAAMVATQLGLEIGPMGRAYLIPYGNEATFVPGWKGLAELAMRSGRASCWTGTIMEGQAHEYQQGDSPRLTVIENSDEDDPAKIAYTYAIGRIKGAEWPIIERWSMVKILKHRDRYNKVGKKHYSFLNLEMYARKVPLLQVLKYLPASTDLEAAMMLDIAAERGQGLTVNAAADAIDGVFAVDEESPAPGASKQSDVASDSSGAGAGGGPTQEQAFAMADQACKDKDWDLARSMLDHLSKPDRVLIESKLPKS